MRRRLTAASFAGAMLFTACGGSGGDDATGTGASADADIGDVLPEPSPDADVTPADPAPVESEGESEGESEADDATAPAEETAPVEGAEPEAPDAAGSGIIDLGGEAVSDESDFEGNLLPDVVVDDITAGRKVNFRNLVPREKPILLWMYAPH